MLAWNVLEDEEGNGVYGSGVTLLIVIGLFMFVVIGGIAMISCIIHWMGLKVRR